MRDIVSKSPSLRTARAIATVHARPEIIERIRNGDLPKGDPIPFCRAAAMIGAKQTSALLPFCHPIPIESLDCLFLFGDESVTIEVSIKAVYRTGVEMEALTAAAVAALNLYDMLKPIDDDIQIGKIELLEKTGGKSELRGSVPFHAAIVVASDRASRGEYEDQTGPLARERLSHFGAIDPVVVVVSDDVEHIQEAVRHGIAGGNQLVLVCGGTGVGPRDNTASALLPLLEKRLNGLESQLLSFGLERQPKAMLGNPVAGLASGSIVIGLPGSPGAASDAIDALFPYVLHALEVLEGSGHG